jgi:hypothetical protein
MRRRQFRFTAGGGLRAARRGLSALVATIVLALASAAGAQTLADPAPEILDTGVVIAKRIKYRRPIYSADRSHLHHRFLNIGFSQRRAALVMWGWTATLGAAALATRFIPFREGGDWHLWETVAIVAIALVALAYSVYIVYLLEIVKLANPFIRRREELARAEQRKIA